MKKINDYLHLYLGCPVMIGDYRGTLSKVGYADMNEDCEVSGNNQDEESGFYGEPEVNEVKHKRVKPILRPLSSMTEEERKELDVIRGTYPDIQLIPAPVFGQVIEFVPMVFHFLLSKHFDLFGLIDAGLAIDSTTL